jgi:large subunit ribosomal protein L24
MAKRKIEISQPRPRLQIRKGDIVEAISGDDRGKRGKVLKVNPKDGKIIIEGINFISRHTRASRKDPKGGVQKREAPINVSNVMIICPKCGKKTRIGHLRLSDSSKARVCKHKNCGEMIEYKQAK